VVAGLARRAGGAAATPANIPAPVQALLRDLATELSGVEGCVAVVLYGSAARGELRPESDLDVLVLFDVGHRPELGPESLQVSARSVAVQARYDLPWPVSCFPARADLDGLDPDFLTWVASDGIVLWARADFLLRLAPDHGRLEPYVLVTYDQSRLTATSRVGLNRALFGYRTAKTVNGKRYQSERPGLVQFPGQRLGPGVLFVPAHQDAAVRAVLDRYGVSYGRTPVWR
jgi:predicted nucleotidyltransferase